MLILTDSNILVYSANQAAPFYQPAVDSTSLLRQRGDTLCVIPQNLYEFWTAATRPIKERGLGMTTAQAALEVRRIRSLFRFFADTPLIYPAWENLVSQHSVAGKNGHDARIAAAMNVHGITHLLTFNGSDFKRFQGVTVIDPTTVK
jgi:predicted nucleic acid-binding protein